MRGITGCGVSTGVDGVVSSVSKKNSSIPVRRNGEICRKRYETVKKQVKIRKFLHTGPELQEQHPAPNYSLLHIQAASREIRTQNSSVCRGTCCVTGMCAIGKKSLYCSMVRSF